MTMAADDVQNDQNKQKKLSSAKEEEAEVDIDNLMDDIRKKVSQIYSICKEESILEAKMTIEILREVELKLNN